MLSETLVSTCLEVSITGAGLVLAVYALVTPLSEKIFARRAEQLEHLLKDFEKEKSRITPDAANKDFKHLLQLRDNIGEIKIFPRYLSYGILTSFGVFIFSALADFAWLANTKNQVPENDLYIIIPFLIAIFLFFAIGVLTIGEIFRTMKKEFEDIKKKQKEIKETTNEGLEKIKKDVEELKQKEDMRVSG